ncbi:MAG: hypothetical protein AAGI34_05110 [Pseudomonadota bacterium]
MILLITGIFAGIAVCMATLHALSQAILLQGRARWAYLVQVLAILLTMGLLLEREVGLARLSALPLLVISTWVFAVEHGWYRIFPALVQLFAVLLLAGYVALQ